MIIEHVFVTTLDAADALRLASEYLVAGGFSRRIGEVNSAAGGGGPGAPGAGRATLDVGRGRPNAARAKSIDELPQRLWLEWDRGRVTVAASIEFFQAASFTAGSRKEPPANSPKIRQHVELMHAMVQGLEAALAHRVPPDEARRPWAELEARLREESLRKRRRRHITLWSVLGGIVLLIVLVIVLNTR